MSNNLLRILTAVVGIPLILWLTIIGGWPFALLVLTLAVLAQYELYGLLNAAGLAPNRAVGLLIGALMVLQVMYRPLLAAAVGVLVVTIAASPLARVKVQQPGLEEGETPAANPASLAATVFGVIYPAALLAFLLELRMGRGAEVGDFDAFVLTLTLFLLAWATDTFAYYVGRSLGKHPLAPAVSPKKTWEGAIGGTMGAIFVAVVLKVSVLPFLPWVHAIVLSLLVALLGQLGDLAESKMKRVAGVKDSGNLLPGHGGMLDRFDAMIVVAPTAYLYLRYVAQVIE